MYYLLFEAAEPSVLKIVIWILVRLTHPNPDTHAAVLQCFAT